MTFRSKKEVIKAFCKLSNDIAKNEGIAHDCFCGDNKLVTEPHYNFSPIIIEYIKHCIKQGPSLQTFMNDRNDEKV